MNLIEAARSAGQGLAARKLRTSLTSLGVLIGVASVVAVTSLGAAFEASIVGQFDDVDARSVFVTATLTDPTQGPPDAGQFGTIFTEVDRQGLLRLPGVEDVVAEGSVAVTGLSLDGQELPLRRITATSASSPDVREGAAYASGGPFRDGEPELVLGDTIARALGGGEAVAAGVQVALHFPDGSRHNVTVAGVLLRQDALFGVANDQVYGPLDPFYSVQRQSPSTGQVVPVYDGFTVFAGEARDVGAVRDAVRIYMDGDSDAARLRPADVQILVATVADITSGIQAAFDQVTVFVAAIAATSLLVAGIMIGTIMLINVTERTREIGVLKAIGARDREVLWIFLMESSAVGLMGGLLGIGVGLGAGYALVQGLFSAQDVSFVVPWAWTTASLAVGVLTGLVAGILPARRATRIQPVAALAHE